MKKANTSWIRLTWAEQPSPGATKNEPKSHQVKLKAYLKTGLVFCLAIIALHAMVAARYRNTCPMNDKVHGRSDFSAGSPVETITDAEMSSFHGPSPLTSPAGYGFTNLPANYTPGQSYSITFSHTSGTQFKGFLIWVAKPDGTTVGGFSNIAGGHLVGNAVTHNNNTFKNTFTFTYTPPVTISGPLDFHFVVVQNNALSWAIGNETIAQAALPVELNDFMAKPEGKKVRLNWSTENETNARDFEIERRANGQKFTSLSMLPTKGSNSIYAFLDEAPLIGINYYRLKTNDLDGHSAYSRIIAVQIENNQSVKIYPSPTADELNVENAASLEVFNKAGQMVLRRDILSTKDLVSLNGLPNGIYLVKGMDYEQGVFSQTIIKQ